MALPQSLAGVAQYLGKEGVNQLVVKCFYCADFLTWADKVLYDHAKIDVIWVDGGFYAACYSCTKANARVDFMINYEGVANVDEIELQYGRSIEDLQVRCTSCLREFNSIEKRDVRTTDPDLFIVRGNIRTLCVVCKVLQ